MTYHPDDETSTVIATISVNALTGGAFYILFELLRYQNDIYASKKREKKHRVPPLPPTGLLKWLTHTLSISDEETLRCVGVDGYLFLRFLRLCANFSIVCGLAGALILWPVYFTSFGHVEGIAGINLYTMGNIEQGGNRLWASVVFCWLFSLYFLYLMHEEYRYFVRLRQAHMYEGDEDVPAQKNYTIQVENIPFYYRSPSRLRKLFEDLFPGQVYSSYIACNLVELEKLIKRREKSLRELELAVAYYKSKNMEERKVISLRGGLPVWCGGTEKADAIDYYTDNIASLSNEICTLRNSIADSSGNIISPSGSEVCMNDKLNSKVDEVVKFAMSTSNGPTMFEYEDTTPPDISLRKFGAHSGTGFITFTTRRAHSSAYQMRVLSDVHSHMTVSQASGPADIIWENLTVSNQQEESGRIITKTVFSLGMLFWGSVLAFIAAVSKLSNLEKYLPFIRDLNPIVYSLLAGVLPVIVMNIFLSMLPAIFAYGAKCIEKRKRNSDVQFEVFQWFFGYQLANVYLTLLTGSMFSALAEALAHPPSIIRLLAAALPSVSVFFSNYIITEILTSAPGELLQLVPMLIYNFYKRVLNERTLTIRSLLDGPLAPVEVDYGTSLPSVLFIVCIVLTYMVIAPFITVLGALYFLVFYAVMKYQYLYVYVPQFETGGRFWYGLYGFSMKGLLVSSVTMVGYLAVKEGVAQAPFALPIPFVILYAWNRTVNMFERVSSDLAYSRAVQADSDESASDEILRSFTPTLYTQPALLEKDIVEPEPYRKGGIPLFNQKGELSVEYTEDGT
mmetsp:Transcript_15394/g.23198  ORF Transcript_15394/g.23198 Transcript_15394/m.23198 type:complete len:791 (+) Transcript_15394:97-2469(+)